jgi:hypothetical protein
MIRHSCLLVCLVLLAGCGARVGETQFRGNLAITPFSQKDAIGPNLVGAVVEKRSPLPPRQPEVVRYKYCETTSVLTWDGCPDETPNPRARNIHREEIKTEGYYDGLIPGEEEKQPIVVYGTGQGPMEAIVPAAVNGLSYGFGQAFRNVGNTNINQTGGGASIKGSGNSYNENINKNYNRNNLKQNTDVNQNTTLKNKVGVDIDNN